MALCCCIVGFLGCFLLGRGSLSAGIGGVLTMGYLYGILRANYLTAYAHFMFDCAVLGFYLSLLWRRRDPATAARTQELQTWVVALIGWAVVMFLIPMQNPLIQLVGLRGNAFLLPFVLIGGWLRPRELNSLALWLAGLNLLAFSFAGAEYVLGVPAFFPVNPVTELIYKSNDVAGYTAYRIPACFVSPHAYAGTMVSSLGLVIGSLVQPGTPLWRKGVLAGGAAAAVLGVFLTATRVNVALLFVLLVVATLSSQLKGIYRLSWVLILAGIGYVVSSEERLQRFLTLGDTEQVMSRVGGSVNMNFWELLSTYPMGNGMGAGGTSIPYFLQGLISKPIGMENEYCRILLEEGLPGLLLWIGFLCWALTRGAPPRAAPWFLGWRLLWYTCLGSFATGLLGIGLMTAIPQTTIFFLSVGFLAVRQPAVVTRRPRDTGHGSSSAPADKRVDDPTPVLR
jgi:hypothetical protein